MGIIRNIKNRFFATKKELTPKGECLRQYVNDIVNGKNVFIQDYEDMIDAVMIDYKSKMGVDTSREEVAQLMSTYFEKNF